MKATKLIIFEIIKTVSKLSEFRFLCSECGYKLMDVPTNYCPNCGAKMDKKEQDNGYI